MTKACSLPEMALRGGALGRKPAAVGVPYSLTCSAGAASVHAASVASEASQRLPKLPARRRLLTPRRGSPALRRAGTMAAAPGQRRRRAAPRPRCPIRCKSGLNPDVSPDVPVTVPVGRKGRDEVHTLEALETGYWPLVLQWRPYYNWRRGTYSIVYIVLGGAQWVPPTGPGPAGWGASARWPPPPGPPLLALARPLPRARQPAQLVRARPHCCAQSRPGVPSPCSRGWAEKARHRFYEVGGAPGVRPPGMRGGGR